MNERDAFADEQAYIAHRQHEASLARAERRRQLAAMPLSTKERETRKRHIAMYRRVKGRIATRRWRLAHLAYARQRVLDWQRKNRERHNQHSQRWYHRRLAKIDGDLYREVRRDQVRATRDKYRDKYNQTKREKRAARTPEQVASDAAKHREYQRKWYAAKKAARLAAQSQQGHAA